jgi:hypothetical protein
VRESLSGNLTEHRAGVGGELERELGSVLRLLRPTRFQIVGTVEHPADHVPFGEPYRVVANGVQHSAV